ncbi:MAG: hypothetical protein CSA58_08320 [Micrococcales bacterium]|nr:MAG: hypothetical protein CSA58_08320 [Micrococcales bacterium]
MLDVIEDRIRKASRLVDAAEALAEGDKIQERVEILAKTEELLDNKDAVSEEFNRLVAEATRQDEAADAAFSDADEPATCQAEALDLAEQRERTIRRDLRATDRKTNRAKSLKKDCDRLRDRIAALRRT